MNIAVIGVGHVGLVTAACLAELGHRVVGVDHDADKLAVLKRGDVWFHEADLPELVRAQVEAGRLTYSGAIAEAITDAEVVFICVGTPSLPGGGPDLRYVERAGAEVAAHARNDLVLVEKSTVPASTGERLTQVIAREQARSGNRDAQPRIEVASNPEFLREGSAVRDTLEPDRIVYGTPSDWSRDVLRRVYAPLVERTGCPVVETDVTTAELIKHASNAFLATRLSFINAVANICDRVGADVEVVAQGMGHDVRIGPHFLKAGVGFGGSCLLGDETVLTRHDGQIVHRTMSELWMAASGNLEGWEVLAWDPASHQTVFRPISAVTLRPYDGEIVEVRTKMGRRVRCTVDHPWFVRPTATGSLEVRLADDLTTDMWLPLSTAAAVNVVPASSVARSEVLEVVEVGVATPQQVIHRLDKTDAQVVRERAGGLPPARRAEVLRRGVIRLSELESLNVVPSGGSYGTAKNGTYVPGEIPLDAAFWRMIGLFLAEGFLTADGRRERISWAFHPTEEQDLVDYLLSYWSDLGVKAKAHRRTTAMVVSISSRLLAAWFEIVLDVGRDSYGKRVPDQIWTAPEAHKRALLRGLWDGDGSWSLVAGGPSVVLEYGTVSRPLADAMLRLLGELGLVARLKVGRTAKSTVDTYWLVISGADQVERALWLFPDDEAAEIRGHLARQSKRIAPTGYRPAGDTAWLRIAQLRRERFRGPVYSLEVPGAHTVVTSGGLVTHNCFPKDVDAFLHLSRSVGYEFGLLDEVRRINEGQRQVVLDKLRDELWHLEGKTVTLLGAAFKPGTDDLREAPAVYLAKALLADGATVRVYDPVALPNVKVQLPDVEVVDDPLDACRGAHAAVICTEWPEIAALDPADLVAALDYPILVDGRNCLDPHVAIAAGLRYHGIGRGHLRP